MTFSVMFALLTMSSNFASGFDDCFAGQAEAIAGGCRHYKICEETAISSVFGAWREHACPDDHQAHFSKPETREVTKVGLRPSASTTRAFFDVKTLQGLLASGSHDNTIKLWRVSTGERIRTLTGHGNTIRSVSFDMHGLFVSSSDDYTIKVWDSL